MPQKGLASKCLASPQIPEKSPESWAGTMKRAHMQTDQTFKRNSQNCVSPLTDSFKNLRAELSRCENRVDKGVQVIVLWMCNWRCSRLMSLPQGSTLGCLEDPISIKVAATTFAPHNSESSPGMRYKWELYHDTFGWCSFGKSLNTLGHFSKF